MIHATKILSTALVIGLAGATGACVAKDGWHESNAVKSNEVELVRMTHLVRFDRGSARMNDAERAALMRFLAETNVGYGDEIWIDAGDGAPSGDRRAALRSLLAARGLAAGGDGLAYGAAPGADEVRIVVGRYVVTPPECPDWRKPASRDFGNTPSSNLGCATMTNLGLMVANPRDLLEGRDYAGPDTVQASDAVRAYREGEVEDVEETETREE